MSSNSVSAEKDAATAPLGPPYVNTEPSRETKTDNRHWVRDLSLGTLALSDQIVVSGTSFATTLLLSNLCSKPEMGVFGLAWTVFGFQRTAQERMLSAPYLVFAHQSEQDGKAWLGSSLFHQGVFALICTMTTWLLAAVIFYVGRPVNMSPVMWTMGLMVTFLLLRDHIRTVSSAHFRYDVALALDVCVSVIQIGGLGILFWFDLLSISTTMIVLGLACLVPAAVWIARRPQAFRLDRARIRSDWITSWGYSKWLVAARSIGISGFYLLPWVVAYMMDEAAVGVFTVCCNLVGLSLMFIMGVNNFFTPRTVKAYQTGGKKALVRVLAETIFVFATVLSGVSIGLYFTGDWLLGFYGPEYVGYGSVVFYLSLSMLTVCISIAWGNGLAALGKPRGYFWGELAYFAVSLGLALILIPILELNGAAIALVGGGIAVSVVTGFVLVGLLAGGDDTGVSPGDAL